MLGKCLWPNRAKPVTSNRTGRMIATCGDGILVFAPRLNGIKRAPGASGFRPVGFAQGTPAYTLVAVIASLVRGAITGSGVSWEFGGFLKQHVTTRNHHENCGSERNVPR